MSNSPSLIIDHCMMAAVPQYHLARLMNDAAGRLADTQRERVMNLAVFGDKAPDEHYRVGRIYATSAYMLDSDVAFFGDGCGVGALFPECELYRGGPRSCGCSVEVLTRDSVSRKSQSRLPSKLGLPL